MVFFSSMGIVYDIRTTAYGEGADLRTRVYLKGCPLACQWCNAPQSWNPNIEIGFNDTQCKSCFDCVRTCPHQALEKSPDGPIRLIGDCQVCGICVNTCPHEATVLIGEEMTPGEVLRRVLIDRDYYEIKHGGVTFTGGEPTAQPRFLVDCMELARNEKLQTALETSGYFPTTLLEPLIDLTDRFYFDLKLMDSKEHHVWTGVPNAMILKNFRSIWNRVGTGRLVARLPLIPKATILSRNIEALIEFFDEIRYHGVLELIPYDPLSQILWRTLGKEDDYRNFGNLEEKFLKGVTARLEQSGINCRILR